ncbi:hypothetical protein VKT23_015289 [Stygiomarasmius scandens]|uniref:Uncharacterized protein n=1 Tax=Marasmiellus scandens TaxID=2682957 RepID=A0ABR1J0R4_9AGAR
MTTSYPLDAFSTTLSSFDSELKNYQLLKLGKNGFLPAKVPNVEYHWGLHKDEFKTDDTSNQLLVRTDIPYLLERGLLSIVPALDTLKKMLEVVKSNESKTRQPVSYTESFPVREYEYVLVPLRLFKGTIHVRNPASGDVQSFESPYQGLPTFVSRAHPYCVALWCAAPILCFANSLLRSDWGSNTCVVLSQLAIAWYKEPPFSFIAGPDYEDEDEDEDEGSEDRSLDSDSCDSEGVEPPTPHKSRTNIDSHRPNSSYGYLSVKKLRNINSWVGSTNVVDHDREQTLNSHQVTEYRREPHTQAEWDPATQKLTLVYPDDDDERDEDETYRALSM